MIERNITITDIEPVDLLGVNNSILKYIKSRFPNLKIISRGRNLKFSGEEEELDLFEEKINLMINYFKKYNTLDEGDLENILGENGQDTVKHTVGDQVIVHGNNGKKIAARTHNQRKLVESSFENDMIFAVGPAGTGKTYTAVALAVRALKNKEVKKIILTRPAVEAGENLGFLPGDLKEKLDPYLQPLYDALRDMIPAEKLEEHLENNVVQIAPLAFMRGRTLDNAFVILDEAQNATESQIKMFLTRMGKSAKFIINGDPSQIDLPRNQNSGLIKALTVLKDIEGIGIIELDENDVIRHKLVKRIIKAFK
ncbi:PhoH family protein [Flavobacteriales bacterium]|nr:PhoH family protein [Flavobacteriales bacterium]